MKATAALVAAALSVVNLSARANDNEAIAKAQAAATKWLAQIDGTRYGPSWDEAAALFKAAVTKSDWEKSMAAVRAPLGALKVRTLKSGNFMRTLPGAPDGAYVVIQYETTFANKASAVETVTPMLDKDGAWRVSGYYIR